MYAEALSFYEKAQLETLEEKHLPPRSLKVSFLEIHHHYSELYASSFDLRLKVGADETLGGAITSLFYVHLIKNIVVAVLVPPGSYSLTPNGDI